MSFLDFLTGKTECPNCGTKGAKKSGDQIRCPNPHCSNFDPELAGRAASFDQADRVIVRRNPQTGEPIKKTVLKGGFTPARPLTVRYLNHQKQEKTFTVDAGSAVRKRSHITFRVAPSGIRIALSPDRIQNLQEVEEASGQRFAPGQKLPSPAERQVLSYHKNRGTTSPLYEKIRGKYPHW